MTTPSPAAIVIVGAGEAGTRAALALREAGHAGPVTLVGEEAHAPYERPPLSKAVIAGAEAPQGPAAIAGAARFTEVGITHLTAACAVAIDRAGRRLRLADGSSLPYDRLLIAAGARPRRLAAGGDGLHRVTYLRTFADALAVRGHLGSGGSLVIIGAGFIGLEIAAAAAGRGTRVTIVELGARILMRGVPAPIAERIAARHQAAGVEIRLGIGLEAIEAAGTQLAVRLADGTRILADGVIAGIGAVPETALAAEAGLSLDNGIAVDGRLCTSDPLIFAAGDCCSFPHPLYGGRRLRLEAWRNAQDQGAFAARAMLGAEETYAAVPWFWSDQYEETLQIAGLPDAGTKVVSRPVGPEAVLDFHLDGEGRLVAVCGYGPNRLIAKDVRVGEMLIAARARPDPAVLASPATRLRTLLAA